MDQHSKLGYREGLVSVILNYIVAERRNKGRGVPRAEARADRNALQKVCAADDIRRELREGRRRAIGKAADTRRGKGTEYNSHLERPRRQSHARGRKIPRDTAVSQYRV